MVTITDKLGLAKLPNKIKTYDVNNKLSLLD